MAISDDGMLWGWGNNGNGNLGLGDKLSHLTPVLVSTDSWSDIDCNRYHSAGVKSDGTLWVWGTYAGQPGLGNGSTNDSLTPVQVGSDSDWLIARVVYYGTLALKKDGTLWSWGYGSSGQLGTGSTVNVSTPTQVGSATWRYLSTYGSASGRRVHGIQTDGTLWSWGQNDGSGILGTGDTANRLVPTQVGAASTWTVVSTGQFHSLALRSDKSLWAWGGNSAGALGDGTAIASLSPKRIGLDTDWVNVSAGSSVSYAVKENNSTWGWGSTYNSKLGAFDYGTNLFVPQDLLLGVAPIHLSAHQSGLVMIATDGRILSLGGNAGAHGDGTGTVYQLTPQIFDQQTSWRDVAASIDCNEYSSEMLAIRTNGEMWGMGMNANGELGTGTLTPVDNFKKLNNDLWLSVDSRNDHTIAIKADQTLWGWGRDSSGELGQGISGFFALSPQQIGTDRWNKVVTSLSTSGGIKDNGTLWMWGSNWTGQIGDSTTIDRNLPTQVGSDSDWIELSVSNGTVLALKSDGSLWAWGRNHQGQLGDGTTINRLIPVRIGSDSWVAIAVGEEYHSHGIKSDGTLWSWGDGSNGLLGLGNTSDYLVPTQVGSVNNWKSVYALSERNCNYSLGAFAVRNDKSVWAWGNNWYGSLGTGNFNSYSTPLEISLPQPPVLIKSGSATTYAISDNGTLLAWGFNEQGEVDKGLPNSVPGQAHLNVSTRLGVTSVDFGTVSIGDTRILALPVINNSNVAISVNSIETSVPFTAINTCTTVLANSACNLEIRCAPQSSTTAQGGITVHSNSFGSGMSVTTSCTGVVPTPTPTSTPSWTATPTMTPTTTSLFTESAAPLPTSTPTTSVSLTYTLSPVPSGTPIASSTETPTPVAAVTITPDIPSTKNSTSIIFVGPDRIPLKNLLITAQGVRSFITDRDGSVVLGTSGENFPDLKVFIEGPNYRKNW